MSGLRCGKFILEMIGNLVMVVYENLTEFSRGRSVSGEGDVSPIGP